MFAKNSFLTVAVSITTAVLLFNACAARKGTKVATNNECAGVAATYNTAVKSIISDACGSKCHSAQYKAGGIDLSNYASIKDESSKARFMGSLRHLAGFEAMPRKAPKFSDSVIKVLNCWIKNGSPE